MYEAYFGLKRNPFGMTPDPGTLFWTVSHREALAGLTYAIKRRKGFVVLTGPAGTGKTTLLRKLLDSSPVPMRTSYVYNSTLTAPEFLELALADFDISAIHMNKAQRLLRLEQFLLETYKAEKVAVLIIDEAHKLSPELLEEVRLLTNFETAKEKLLQIVLAGQPELDGLLNREDLRQLKQRIAVRLQIQPIETPDIRQYLNFRWVKAGGAEPLPFNDGAIELIASWSKGVPRVMNGICDNALLLAYGAERNMVGPDDIREVVRDLDLRGGTVNEMNRRNGAAAAPRTVATPTPVTRTPVESNGNHASAQIVPSSLGRVPLERYGERDEESVLGRLAGKLGIRLRRAGVSHE
jgi:general secretion pathway protein A